MLFVLAQWIHLCLVILILQRQYLHVFEYFLGFQIIHSMPGCETLVIFWAEKTMRRICCVYLSTSYLVRSLNLWSRDVNELKCVPWRKQSISVEMTPSIPCVLTASLVPEKFLFLQTPIRSSSDLCGFYVGIGFSFLKDCTPFMHGIRQTSRFLRRRLSN